ncbi:MAG: PAS domain-containing sensor histidine kinase [Candidatus Eisenbacteria bacterium]|nr:PAS domain-containing sensor histidine kinase [Candidatus Eisenbacteria bacterium]
MALQVEVDYVSFVQTLPIGAYQVDAEGRFVYCNDAFARIFGYDTATDLIPGNIVDFYPDPQERERLISWMRSKSGVLVNETIYLKNKHEKPVVVSDSSQLLYDPEDRTKVVGIRGVMIDVGYRKLIDSFNAGIYTIDAEDRIVKVNRAVARMFGFEHPRQLEGMSIGDLYKNKADLAELKARLEKDGVVENYPIAMKKKDGEEIIISVTTSVMRDRDGRVIGREGIFTDITNTERIRNILENMPTGAYQVENDYTDTPRIRYCNAAFARMFGYSTQEMCGMDIRSLYANRTDVDKFELATQDAYSKGQPLCAHELLVKDREGNKFWIAIDCFPNSDHRGNITGRQGTIRDITIKRKLEAVLRGTEDVQRFAHRFMAPMMSIYANTGVVLEEMERVINIEIPENRRKEFGGLSTDGVAIARAIREATQGLLDDLKQLADLLEREDSLAAHRKQLDEHAARLRALKGDRRVENMVELRQEQRNLADSLLSLRKAVEQKPDLRRVSNKILTRLRDLDKFYILFVAQLTTNTSEIAYLEVESLRAYMLQWGHGKPETAYEFKAGNLYNCILEVANIYQLYAMKKGLEIVVNKKGYVPPVEMSVRDIKWMLHYLVQNAVKYSFRREGFVKVEIGTLGNDVTIEIENYGVGILPEEIEEGMIFEHGYRGKFSGDWNRVGSGIGLSEALRIALGHGGRIEVSSHPIPGYQGEINKDTPFITKVKVWLPLAHRKTQQSGGEE